MPRPLKSVDTYLEAIRAGDRVLLGQAITLIESKLPEHQKVAQNIINQLITEKKPENTSFRIGVTGSPGVGKSTFIEALGYHLVEQGKRVAVLAIDPTSQLTKGSILGDKTRMEKLAASENAFIRPSPSGETLGGVARKTRETLLLVEAAGFDHIFIETVGVGQSETMVHEMTDIFLLLLLPGAGDELQGIKRGIVEMADIIAVNKAEGERQKLANQARAHYLNAVHFFPPKLSGTDVKVLTCSALENKGIAEVWETMLDFKKTVVANGFFEKRRKEQAKYWFDAAVETGLHDFFYNDESVRKSLAEAEAEILAGHISPFAAAQAVLEKFFHKKN